MPLVTDNLVQAAFDYLKDSPERAAAARAARHMAEYRAKKTRASLFLEAPDGTVDFKRAWVESHDKTEAAVKAEVDAIGADETHKEYTKKSLAILEAWRTEQANMRKPNV